MADDIRTESGGYIGQSVPRREDRNLLLGQGEFVADMQLPGMVHAAFARSPLAHAEIGKIDLEAARAVEGVHFAADGKAVCADLPPINGMQVVTPQFVLQALFSLVQGLALAMATELIKR